VADTVTVFTVDLASKWVKIGEASAFRFQGNIRANTTGEWVLTIPANGYSGTLTDVNTVMVRRYDDTVAGSSTIVYAGTTHPTGTVDGGVQSATGPDGTVYTLTGVDMFGNLDTRFVYPDPSQHPTGSWPAGSDDRTGPASTVAAGYLNANAGPTAPLTNRRIVGLEIVDPGVGSTVSWTGRGQPVGQLVGQICRSGLIVCRPSMPTAGTQRYTFTTPTDRRDSTVIVDRTLGGTINTRNATASATYVVAAGTGTGQARAFVAADNGAIGFDRVERIYDVSVLSDPTSLLAAAEGELAVRAAQSGSALQEPVNLGVTYPTDFDVGDTISIEVDGVRRVGPVSAVAFDISPSRATIVPIQGDTSTDDQTAQLRRLFATSAFIQQVVN